MPSTFNPEEQVNNIDFKLIYSLERLSQVYKTLLLQTQVETSLSPIQSQIIIFMFFHNDSRISVSLFASEFSVKKSTISDAVKTLVTKNLVKKEQDSLDKRKQYLKLTKDGLELAQRIQNYTLPLEESLRGFNNKEKINFFSLLTKFLGNLNNKSLLPALRICSSCYYYEQRNKKNYCKLLEAFLNEEEIRVDCQEHIKKDN